ncbi:hypothetical protein TW65_03500 [Stemphylium lycopersici]|nr:hypothetical protein TW65_03500 [Stemphylium lycopersici]
MTSDKDKPIASGAPALDEESNNDEETDINMELKKVANSRNLSGMENDAIIGVGDGAEERAAGENGAINELPEAKTPKAFDSRKDKEQDTAATPSIPIPFTAPLGPESLHTLLIHLSFLALSHHPSRPVIELCMKAQVLQLDAFLSGNVTEDGDAIHWLPESETEERLDSYKSLSSHLVPKITAAINKQSGENLVAEAKNRVYDDEKPGHGRLCGMFLAPKVIGMYGEWVEKQRKKEESFDPDFDPWVSPIENRKLINLLNTIVDIQYDFDTWQHISPKPLFNQLPRIKGVEFQRVMSNFGSIRTEYRITTSRGKTFSQTTTIPETDLVYTEKEARKMWRDKKRSKYFLPDPVDVTVPKKEKEAIWHNADGEGKKWTRGDTSFEPTLIFFVFDEETDAYIHHHIVSPNILDEIDLNKESWVVTYRKKLSQWRKRGTGETTKVRDHWSDDEKAAIYAWANMFCKKNGIDHCTPRRIDAEKADVLKELNKTVPGNRSMESVSAWTRTQMTKKPNLPLGLLAAEQQRVDAMVNNNQPVSESDRYPDQFIDVSGFLAQSKKKAPAKKAQKKRKRGKDQEEEEGISNNPANFNIDADSDDDAMLAFEAEEDDSDDESPIALSHETRKRTKGETPNLSDDSDEVPDDDEGSTRDFIVGEGEGLGFDELE